MISKNSKFKMKNVLVLFIIGILLVSCIQKKQDAINSRTVFLLQEPRLDLTLNTLFDRFEYIALETTKESLFGTINKLIVYDDKYFIMDNL